MARLLALPGDGIGPEILDQALRVLEVLAVRADQSFDVDFDLLHGASFDRHGVFCTEAVLAKAQQSDAVLVGAVGGAKWDNIRMPGGPENQDGLMYLRHHLQTYLGLRPARSWSPLLSRVPLRSDLADGADIMILREMCGGAMFATMRGQRLVRGRREGFDLTAYDDAEIERFARGGFELARMRRRRVVSCDKSNVMESYKLWRTVVSEVALDYPDVEFENMFADNCAFQMMTRPRDFDVVLACNQLGDVFSDLTGVLAGSLGMLPSACLSKNPSEGAAFGIYESTSGSAPDIAGKGIANPIGMILSVGLMFEHSFDRPDIRQTLDQAVNAALADGFLTPDVGGKHSTIEVTDAVLDRVS